MRKTRGRMTMTRALECRNLRLWASNACRVKIGCRTLAAEHFMANGWSFVIHSRHRALA